MFTTFAEPHLVIRHVWPTLTWPSYYF